jgi:lysophospholipase
METFGSGNGPTKPDLLQELRVAAEQGLIIVNCTHCLQGAVTSDYASGMVGVESGPGTKGGYLDSASLSLWRSQGQPPFLVPLQAMAGAGIVSGFDMTSEAALAKLSYVLGQPGLSLNDRKKVGVPLGLGALPRAHEYLLTTERARRSVCVLEVEGKIGPVLTQFIQATP